MKLTKHRLLVTLLMLPLLGLLSAAGYYVHLRRGMDRDLGEMVAALDRDDPGWRLADLERQRTAIPAEENSGPIIRKLRSQIAQNWWKEDEEVPGVNPVEPPPGEPLTPRQAEFLKGRMEEIAKLLPEIRALADKPRGSYPIAWTPDVIGTLVPHVQEIREMGALLHRDVRWQTHLGEHEGALKSCRAIVSVGRTLDNEPTLVSQLVRTACMRMALDGAQHSLASCELPSQELVALQKACAAAERHDSSIVGLRGERAGMHHLFSNLADGTVPASAMRGLSGTLAGAPPGAGGAGVGILNKAEEVYLMSSAPSSHVWIMRHFHEAVEACKLPAAVQDARIKELNRAPVSAPALAKLLACGWPRCHEAFRRDRARTRCAIAAIGAERYRLKHGDWPGHLALLVPAFMTEVPRDPYTDMPLNYRQTPNGVVIYSVGPNGDLKGDFYDQLNLPVPANPGLAGNHYEFRLWDPDMRGRPLAERIAQKD